MSQSTSYTANGMGEVERQFRGLILDASLSDDGEENVFSRILRAHFGVDPMTLATTTEEKWDDTQHAANQAAIDAFITAPGRRHEVVGIESPVGNPRVGLSVSKLLAPASLTWPGVTYGQASWERLPVGYERMLRCLIQGLILIHDEADGPAAIWVNTIYVGSKIRYTTILGRTAAQTLKIAEEIRHLAVEKSPFIGEMFTAGFGERRYLPRPEPVNRDDLILPSTLLDRIDRHAVGIARASKRLEAAGQHLKRGLLLYGPPGTGKTHSIRYLISQLPRETTIVVASPKTSAYGFERLLPQVGKSAMIFFDDVDQVAGDRSIGGNREALFTLLETMDGLQNRGDILFVLTTNKLGVLEPAIAARPGRIDEVLEIPRPDADCRRRLFARYRQGLDLDISDDEIETMIQRTDGVTASFTKEMLRRATVIAVERGAGPGPSHVVQVIGADVSRALDEMLDPNNPATRLLLGAEPEHAVRSVAITSGASQ